LDLLEADETDDDMLWNDSERMGMLGVSVMTMKALTVKMVTVTLIGRGRQMMICIYSQNM
jgi:hypothetical protein